MGKIIVFDADLHLLAEAVRLSYSDKNIEIVVDPRSTAGSEISLPKDIPVNLTVAYPNHEDRSGPMNRNGWRCNRCKVLTPHMFPKCKGCGSRR